MTPEEFKKAKDELKLSISGMANALWKSPAQVKRYANGTANVPPEIEFRIKHLLKG